MPWFPGLDDMEQKREKKPIEDKKNGEKITPVKENELDNTKKIENINSFYDYINDLFDEYTILLEMQDCGEDITEAVAVINDRLTKVTNLGKEKFNLSDEEITNIKNSFSPNSKKSNFRK